VEFCMQYEIVCSLMNSPDTPSELAVRQVLEAVAALERVLNRNNVASMVQVRDLRRGQTVHEAAHTGHLGLAG